MLNTSFASMLSPAVVPVLIGPLQVLIAILPGLIVAAGAALVSIIVTVVSPQFVLGVLRALWRIKLQAAATVLVVVGLVWGAVKFWPASRAQAAGGNDTTAVKGEDWLAFRGGLGRTGSLPGETGPAEGKVNWAYKTGEWFFSSPTVVGNRVYVASAKVSLGDQDNGEGAIYCLDADTGKVVWESRPTFATGYKTYRATFSSPVVKKAGDKGYLVIGEGLHQTKQARLVCLDTATGKMLWSMQGDYHIECTPVITTVTLADGKTEDRVIVGGGETGGFYCLELASGQLRWHLKGPTYTDCETAIVAMGNRVYLGLGIGGHSMCVVDAVTGTELTRVDTGFPVFSPPAIVEGKMYFGMGNGDFVEPGNPRAGRFWGVDLKKLEAHKSGAFAPDWEVQLEDTVLGAPAVAGNGVYFATVDGSVYWIDRTSGRQRGRWDAREPIKGSPAVTSAYVYVITQSGMLYTLDRESFAIAWAYRVGSGDKCFSSPAVARGHVYVGTESDGLVCVGQPAPPRTLVWSGRLAGPARAGNYFASPLPASATYGGNFPKLDGDPGLFPVVAPPAVMGDDLLVPVAAQVKGGPPTGLACLPAGSEDLAAKPLWHYETANGVQSSPAIVGNTALCVDGKVGDANRSLHAMDLKTGKPLWKVPVAAGATGTLVAGDKQVFVQAEAGKLSCFDLSGKPVWSQAVSGRVEHMPAVTPTMLVVAMTEPNQLLALDRETGQRLWTTALDNPPTAWVMVQGMRVLVPTARTLECRSLLDGSAVREWTAGAPAVASDVVSDVNRVIYLTPEGRVVVVARDSGRLLATSQMNARPGTSPLLGGDNVLFIAPDNRIMRLDLAALTPKPAATAAATQGVAGPVALKAFEWYPDSQGFTGRPTTPMLVTGTGVLVAWEGWGLIRLGASQ